MWPSAAAILASLPMGLAGAGRHDPSTAYDYIVVGGGTAGTALATRLSQELPDSSILLIEAGTDGNGEDGINIPGMKGSTLSTKYDWNFTTVPQAALNGRVLPANRGKVLGGSSTLNLMTWNRASAAEYDAWEELGNPGWNWRNMIAAMEKAETFTHLNPGDYGDKGIGTEGPIQTVVNRVIPEQQYLWLRAMGKGLGIPHNLNSLGGNPIGYMNQPSNVDPADWTRSYSANAYIPIAGENLETLLETRVAKLELSKGGHSHRVDGVVLENGTFVSAHKEVILSAGTFQSPGLLELSGIGKKSVLSAAGIDQLIDLGGVGENLQDHIRYEASYQLKDSFVSFDILKYNTTFASEQLALWRNNEVSLYDYTGSGYTLLNWAQVLKKSASTLRRSAEKAVKKLGSIVDKKKLEYLADLSVPQIEVIFSDGYTGLKGYPANSSELYGKGFFSLIGAVMHPLSRGTVHISSSDINEYPAIDPNYLSNEYDEQAAIQVAKYCRRIANTEPLSSAWESEYEPGASVQTYEQWRQYVRNSTLSIYHPVGTCAMMAKEYGGVVGPDLKVYGTQNLRVVDASIIPILPSAHLQTAVYGIAERAAEIMIADARSQ